MDDKAIRYDYFDWLCDKVRDRSCDKSYLMLLKDLHNIPFMAVLELDNNRAEDGKYLREEYAMYEAHSINALRAIESADCSVLEVLISIAERIRFELTSTDAKEDDNISKYFWTMIHNLGLDIFDDENYTDNGGSAAIFEIVASWLDRTYSYDGEGGLFPLRNPDYDQRDVEIWYQMQAYLEENYDY